MIYATTGGACDAVLIDGRPGLAATLTYEVYSVDGGAAVTGPTTATGIDEIRTGTYSVDLTAPTASGAYLVRWSIGPEVLAEEDLIVSSGPAVVLPVPGPMLPSLDEVALLIRARTRTTSGVLLGTWSTLTTPTAAQVGEMIAHATPLVVAAVALESPDLPASIRDVMRSAIALRTAMTIERSYYPEQITSGRSPYSELSADFDATLAEAKRHAKASLRSASAGGGVGLGSMIARPPEPLA